MWAQYYILLPPRLSQQLIWSKFNTHGQPGKNITCDLHLDHLNRSFGVNVIPRAIECAGRCMRDMITVWLHFDSLCGIHPVSSSHSTACLEKNLKVLSVSSFKYPKSLSTQQSVFTQIKESIFRSVNRKKILCWMKDRPKAITT